MRAFVLIGCLKKIQIWGCHNSGLFHAFSNFLLHRLGIDRRTAPGSGPLNVTFLSRQTAYRKVLNEDVLIKELRKNSNFNVLHVSLDVVTFLHYMVAKLE